MFFYSLSLQKLIAVLLPLLAQGARDVGQEAKRIVQVLMKKHHQLSVFVGEEYVGEAQEAKELKHVAGGQGRSRAESHRGKAEGHGDEAEGNEEQAEGNKEQAEGNEEEAEGHEEEAEGREEEAKKLAERHTRNQLLGMFICVALWPHTQAPPCAEKLGVGVLEDLIKGCDI